MTYTMRSGWKVVARYLIVARSVVFLHGIGVLGSSYVELGFALASKGYIGDSDVEIFVGVGMTIAAMAWSVLQKRVGWGWKL